MLPTLTGLPGVTLVLVDGPILTRSSNPALRGVNLKAVGGPPQLCTNLGPKWVTVVLRGALLCTNLGPEWATFVVRGALLYTDFGPTWATFVLL